MSQFDWNGVSREALMKTIKFHRPDSPPKAKTTKDGLISDAKAFLVENPDKIDSFFLKLEESKSKKESA